MWNTAVRLASEDGFHSLGLANQGILWSDAAAYHRFSSTGGNALMYLMSDFACQRACEMDFERPDELLRALLPEVWEYGKRVSGLPGLRQTFALNALVALDTAAWLLYARHKGIRDFDGLVPAHARAALSAQTLGVPVIAVGVPTVVDGATLAHEIAAQLGGPSCEALDDLSRPVMITTRDVDREIADVARLIGYAVNMALHPHLTVEDIDLYLS